jgi:hypothetical protein
VCRGSTHFASDEIGTTASDERCSMVLNHPLRFRRKVRKSDCEIKGIGIRNYENKIIIVGCSLCIWILGQHVSALLS